MHDQLKAASLRGLRWFCCVAVLVLVFGDMEAARAQTTSTASPTAIGPLFDPGCYTAGSLANANFEADAAGQPTGWCVNSGYSRIIDATPKYNAIARLQLESSVPAANRSAWAHQTIKLDQTQPKNVFVGGMVRGSSIAVDPGGVGAVIDVTFQVDCAIAPDFCTYAPPGEGPSHPDGIKRCRTLASSGTFGWRWIGLDAHGCGMGYPDATGHWQDAPIANVDVLIWLANATGTAEFDLMQLYQFDPGPGAVTFMFDDGNQSTATVALPILRDFYGYPGSAAITTAFVDTPGHVTAQDLRDLQAAGWDIASHSVSHPSMIAIDEASAAAELVNSKVYLQSQGLIIDTFVWPFGDYSQALIGLAQGLSSTPPLYASTRTVDFGDNAYGTHPYLLKGLGVLNVTTLAEVQSWIRNLKDDPACTQQCSGRWGIFLLHDISNTPNTYDTTPGFLADLAREVSVSGLDVVNYSTGYQRFANVPRP